MADDRGRNRLRLLFDMAMATPERAHAETVAASPSSHTATWSTLMSRSERTGEVTPEDLCTPFLPMP